MKASTKKPNIKGHNKVTRYMIIAHGSVVTNAPPINLSDFNAITASPVEYG